MNFPKLRLSFNEKGIPLRYIEDKTGKPISDFKKALWVKRQKTDKKFSDINLRLKAKNSLFNHTIVHNESVCPTIASAGGSRPTLYELPNFLSDKAIIQVGSFPLDYNFKKLNVQYLIGMSVPPVMTAQIANEIYKQWFKGINAHSS